MFYSLLDSGDGLLSGVSRWIPDVSISWGGGKEIVCETCVIAMHVVIRPSANATVPLYWGHRGRAQSVMQSFLISIASGQNSIFANAIYIAV